MTIQDEGQRQLDALCTGLDLHEPQWFISHANQSELSDYCRDAGLDGTARSVDPVPYARGKLRRRVATRMAVVLRAAVDAGLVTFNK